MNAPDELPDAIPARSPEPLALAGSAEPIKSPEPVEPAAPADSTALAEWIESAKAAQPVEPAEATRSAALPARTMPSEFSPPATDSLPSPTELAPKSAHSVAPASDHQRRQTSLPLAEPQPDPSETGPQTTTEAETLVPAVPEREPFTTPSVQATLRDPMAAESPAHSADDLVLAQSRAHTRRSFLAGATATAAAIGLYEYIERGPQLQTQPALLRRAFLFNAALARGLAPQHILSPTYPLSRAEKLRINGFFGLKRALVPASWRLQVVGVAHPASHPRYSPDVTAWEYQYTGGPSLADQEQLKHINPDLSPTAPPPNAPDPDRDPNHDAGQSEDDNHTGRKPRGMEEAGESNSTLPPRTPGLLLTIDDLLQLPRQELVTQFKCIEGWSQIVHWAGVRVADFLEAYPPASIDGRAPRYVYMETPDGDYYTGYDLQVLRHPQALLVTEMMEAPLTQFHGAPLRLHLPTKYGYKQIKRIGLIAYTSDKPDDYWTRLGYDWYAGL